MTDITRKEYLAFLKNLILQLTKAASRASNPYAQSRIYKYLKRVYQSYNWVDAGGSPSKGEIVKYFGTDATYIEEKDDTPNP